MMSFKPWASEVKALEHGDISASAFPNALPVLEQYSLLVSDVFQWTLSLLWLMLFLAVTLEETAVPNTLPDGLYWMLAIW